LIRSYFYQLSKEGDYGTKTASIEYTDLLEILKALDILIATSVTDKSSTLEYLESKFVADGFEVGYYKSKTELRWYLDLEKYGTDGNVFLSDISRVKTSMIRRQRKKSNLLRILWQQSKDYENQKRNDVRPLSVSTYEKEDLWHYFEIKTDSSKLSIRKALGQILEYAYWPSS